MHVLFDLDGTLTDPQEGITTCIRHALSQLNIEIDPVVDLTSYIGPPLHKTFQTLCEGTDLAETAISLYRERYSELGLYENEVYEGIPECLEQLMGVAESIHVATSKPTVFSERIIDHFELTQYFNKVYGSKLDGSLSDKTELIKHIIDQESLPPKNTVMLGDRRFDMIGAKNHGLKTVGVLWGYGSREELIESRADSLCARPGEIYPQLLSMFQAKKLTSERGTTL